MTDCILRIAMHRSFIHSILSYGWPLEGCVSSRRSHEQGRIHSASRLTISIVNVERFFFCRTGAIWNRKALPLKLGTLSVSKEFLPEPFDASLSLSQRSLSLCRLNSSNLALRSKSDLLAAAADFSGTSSLIESSSTSC